MDWGAAPCRHLGAPECQALPLAENPGILRLCVPNYGLAPRTKYTLYRVDPFKKQIAAWPLETPFPLILAFSLGEKERGLWPAWKSKEALTNPAAGFLAKRGSCLPPRG